LPPGTVPVATGDGSRWQPGTVPGGNRGRFQVATEHRDGSRCSVGNLGEHGHGSRIHPGADAVVLLPMDTVQPSRLPDPPHTRHQAPGKPSWYEGAPTQPTRRTSTTINRVGWVSTTGPRSAPGQTVCKTSQTVTHPTNRCGTAGLPPNHHQARDRPGETQEPSPWSKHNCQPNTWNRPRVRFPSVVTPRRNPVVTGGGIQEGRSSKL